MLTIYQEDMYYDTAKYLIQNDREIEGMCQVVFDDETVTLPVRPVIMMLPYWEVYNRMGRPIKSEHIFFTQTPYNEKSYNKIIQRIYEDCFDSDADSAYFDKLKTCLWDTINNIDDFGSFELLEYVNGLDLISLSEIHQDPKVQEIVNVDMSEELGPMRIKQQLIQGTDELAKLLTTEGALKNEQLLSFMECNSLKISQLYQMLGCYGLRTEINDRVFKCPVKGNSIDGLRDFRDYVFDNTAARKSVYYAYDAIKLSQYFNREMSLTCMPLSKLYQGDCGTTGRLPFIFKKQYMKHYYGKYFCTKNEDGTYSKEHVLTEYNAEKFADKLVYMRSIFMCRHTDGACERCMGLIARNHTKGINIGITASSNAVSSISQLVLSTKHEDQAMPTMYIIPNELKDYLHMTEEGIAFKSSFSSEMKHTEIGIFLEDLICSTGDLEYIRKEIDVPENKYSSIKSFMLRNTKTGEMKELTTKQSEMTPFLTTEFILYIKDHLDKGVAMDEQVFWVPLKNLSKYNIPILRTIVYNNSMMVFVTKLTNIFKKKYLSKYKDASKALQDVSDVVFEKVKDINIFQLELMLRAHTVTNDFNYSIPVIEDHTKVSFKPTWNVISQRTISGQLAHESHNKHFSNALTYVLLKDQNPLDPFVGV